MVGGWWIIVIVCCRSDRDQRDKLMFRVVLGAKAFDCFLKSNKDLVCWLVLIRRNCCPGTPIGVTLSDCAKCLAGG